MNSFTRNIILLIVGLCALAVNAEIQCYSCFNCLEPFYPSKGLLKTCAGAIDDDSSVIEMDDAPDDYQVINETAPEFTMDSDSENEYLCYTIKMIDHCKPVYHRGCARKSNNKVCDIKAHLTTDVSSCNMCYSSECNKASSKLSISIIITLFLAIFVYFIQ